MGANFSYLCKESGRRRVHISSACLLEWAVITQSARDGARPDLKAPHEGQRTPRNIFLELAIVQLHSKYDERTFANVQVDI